MKKKLAMITAAVALGALVTVGATLAWFTSSSSVTNVVTTGNIKVEVSEPNYTKAGGNEAFEDMTPNKKIYKDPTFTLKNSNDAYLRSTVKITMTGAKEGTPTPTVEELGFKLAENWVNKDGVYYYTQIAKNDVPVVLFKNLETDNTKPGYTMQIPANWNNAYQNATITIDVEVEAVQADNFTPDFESATPWGNVEVEKDNAN